jgi:hypothetical protein
VKEYNIKMNEKNIILQKIYALNELYLTTLSEEVLLEMELILMSYLEHYPKDTEIRLKLVMIEFTPPLEDYDKIEDYINAIITYDKDNIKGWLILAYAQYIFRGQIQQDLFLQLKKMSEFVDKELLSMIYLAMAWYYESIKEKAYEQLLLESICFCDKHVKNYLLLGRFYLNIGKKVEGKKMIQIALNNIQKIYADDDLVNDITDVDAFFNEFFKGICITQENFQSIQKLLLS